LYTALASTSFLFGGPLLHGSVRSLLYALPVSFMLALALLAFVLGIGNMQQERRAWYTEPMIFRGLGYLNATFCSLIVLEGLGNDLFSPLIGLTLTGLFFLVAMACLLYPIIVLRKAIASGIQPGKQQDEGSVLQQRFPARSQPKEAREE